MPHVLVKLASGSSEEQKNQLAQEIVRPVCAKGRHVLEVHSTLVTLTYGYLSFELAEKWLPSIPR